ncbi:PAS domain S-box protein [Halorubellus sp. JP-L1]|uniref:PAS domain-containing sensor histidine kinase n=1 Tax=Halorubellus sp. JP-L1 TaxID=2715753 RepID=UPI0014072A89|nr:PAS domain-containing sensor histidine kinase [Halorubellus sp. JP-L1]NHN40271.1 PAS domain S-box protein [Halorubellus sp. JP-L1]
MTNRDEVHLPPILEGFDIGVLLFDPERGAVLEGNRPVEDLYGYSLDELRTMNVEDFTAPSTMLSKEDVLARIERAAGGESQIFEWQIKRANGEFRWTRFHLRSVTINDAEYVAAKVEDMTEYRARERRLGLLSRIVRHNLRNRTNVLLGYADRIKTAVEDESLEEEIETIIEITTEVGTLSDSVKQLEEIAEPDAMEREPTNLRRVVETVVEESQEEYADFGVSIEGPAEIFVIADRGFTYAVEHAVRNAIEHNDQDIPSVSITLREDSVEEYCEVRIADNGPRIPAEEIEVLQKEVETNSTYHGSGVGLWIMQWCISALGGELRFEENTPRGNIVSMVLPKANRQSAQ